MRKVIVTTYKEGGDFQNRKMLGEGDIDSVLEPGFVKDKTVNAVLAHTSTGIITSEVKIVEVILVVR